MISNYGLMLALFVKIVPLLSRPPCKNIDYTDHQYGNSSDVISNVNIKIKKGWIYKFRNCQNINERQTQKYKSKCYLR